MSRLVLFADPEDRTLSDRLVAIAQGEAFKALVGDHLDAERRALRQDIATLSASTGTAFTARLDGVTASLTDPQPRATVVDAPAFAAWADAAAPYEVAWVGAFVVEDEARAVDALGKLAAAVEAEVSDGNTLDAAVELLQVVTVEPRPVLPEDPIGPLLDALRCVLTPTQLIDTETGEAVPGVRVSTGSPQLRVRIAPAAKVAAQARIMRALGLAPIEVDA